METLLNLWADSGVAQLDVGRAAMMMVGLGLLYLAIKKGFEPLLLVPIGIGTVLVNVPGAGFEAAPVYDALGNMTSPGGMMYYIYNVGIASGMFPLIIFIDFIVGACVLFTITPIVGDNP